MSGSVLVTAGGGLLGRYLADSLADDGEPVVTHGDTRSTATARRTEAAIGQLFDLPRLLHAMRQQEVERLVHATDTSDPRVSVAMPVATVVANVEDVVHLLEAARLADVQGRIVLLSSHTVYGDNDGPIDESSTVRPRSPHAVTQITGEHLATVYSELYGLDVVVLRLGEPYGPELEPPPILQTLVRAALKAESYRAPAGADHRFHLTHGEDIYRAVMAALRAPAPRQRVYNITGGESQSLTQIVTLIRERFPQSRIELGGGQLSDLERQGPIDIRAADRDLGYRPLWGFARGLDDYVEWLLAQAEAA